ncbi:MAG: ATP-binding cassette domain-containing protein [Anaerolineales bacterium]
MENDNIVEMKGIYKRFGAVQALRNVDLELRRGEILGLVGDNAAGKSTLMKILAGAHMPDAGEIYIEGKKIHIQGPRHAHELGISMVYQDLALFNTLDVASNIFPAQEPTRNVLGLKLFDKKAMREQASALLKKMKVNISSPKLLVAQMSGGQRQMIAAARALAFAAKIMLLDEPTAALGVREANALLMQIKEWKAQGLSIILITQRIPDVLAVGDRVMVMKGGARQDVLDVANCTLDDVVNLIVKGRAGNGEYYSGDQEVDDLISLG